jgi:hypothetical protein
MCLINVIYAFKSRKKAVWQPACMGGFYRILLSQWITDVDNIEKYDAKVIIPGHQKPGMSFDQSSLDFTRDYLVKTEEGLAKTTCAAGFYYAMAEWFPKAHLNHLSNEMNANVFKAGRSWNWRNIE